MGDEEGLRGGFPQRGDHLVAAWVEEGGNGAADGEGETFESIEGDMGRVVGGRAGENREGACGRRWSRTGFEGSVEGIGRWSDGYCGSVDDRT